MASGVDVQSNDGRIAQNLPDSLIILMCLVWVLIGADWVIAAYWRFYLPNALLPPWKCRKQPNQGRKPFTTNVPKTRQRSLCRNSFVRLAYLLGGLCACLRCVARHAHETPEPTVLMDDWRRRHELCAECTCRTLHNHALQHGTTTFRHGRAYKYLFNTNTYKWRCDFRHTIGQNYTKGDGNCFWRALSFGQNKSWYVLKQNVLKFALEHNTLNPQQLQQIKQMKKRNAWANETAAHAASEYLQRTICVFSSDKCVLIQPTTCSRGLPIFISHMRFHFSSMHHGQGL